MSQDVHTPRVIASEFLSKTPCGPSLSFSARRRPETLQIQAFQVERFMDEVDGRPGHVALQSGHTSAHRGVPTVFLSLPESAPKFRTIACKFTGEYS